MDDFDCLFGEDMPGRITATITPVDGISRDGIAGHWRNDGGAGNRDVIELGGPAREFLVMTEDAIGITRGATIAIPGRFGIDAKEYQITDVRHDDHGITTLEVEPL